jgi:hypothetical protein
VPVLVGATVDGGSSLFSAAWRSHSAASSGVKNAFLQSHGTLKGRRGRGIPEAVEAGVHVRGRRRACSERAHSEREEAYE